MLSEHEEYRRKTELRRDREAYDKRITEKYPDEIWQVTKEQAEHIKKTHTDTVLKIAGGVVLVAVLIIWYADGFSAGFAVALTLAMGVFALKSHSDNSPDVERLSDPRTDEERQEEFKLNMREMNSDYDRKRWLEENR